MTYDKITLRQFLCFSWLSFLRDQCNKWFKKSFIKTTAFKISDCKLSELTRNPQTFSIKEYKPQEMFEAKKRWSRWTILGQFDTFWQSSYITKLDLVAKVKFGFYLTYQLSLVSLRLVYVFNLKNVLTLSIDISSTIHLSFDVLSNCHCVI